MLEDIDTTIQQRLFALVAMALIGFGISWIASRWGYFRLPPDSQWRHFSRQQLLHFLNFRHVITAFAIFLSMELIIAPTLFILWKSMAAQKLIIGETIALSTTEQGWLNMVTVFLNFIGILTYLYTLNKQTRSLVLTQGESQTKLFFFKSYLIGIGTWLIAYPWLIVASQVINIITELTFNSPHIDQEAVRHVRNVLNDPSLLSVTIVAISIFVPVVEEILFRGFLQTWLKIHYSATQAVMFTSAIFAAFHYSSSQQMENIELLLLLFLLSCFLGFLRERQGNLWGSIALHSTFNLLSLQLIIAEKGLSQ